MSELREDPELEGRLDTAFRATRPRRGFEEELWGRLQRRRPAHERLLAALRGHAWAPSLAASLVVLVAGFIFVLGHLPHAGSSATSSSSEAHGSAQQAPAGAGAAPAGGARAAPDLGGRAFGNIPAVPTSLSSDYEGTLELNLAVALPSLSGPLTVYRYAEPTPATAADFARSVGAGSPAPAPAGTVDSRVAGTFAGSGGQLTVLVGDRQNLVGPTYLLSPPSAAVSQGPAPAASGVPDPQAEAAASSFLTQHNLSPASPAAVQASVRNSGASGAQVTYANQFPAGAGQAPAAEVDARGRPVATQVSLRGDGSVFQASGPLPLTVAASAYAPASASKLQAEVRAAPGAGAGASRTKVDLTAARLVYVSVSDGSTGYFEPAILLTGSFTASGSVHQVSLIVPAVDPAQTR